MISNGITVILPVYNEEKAIHSTIEQIKRVMLSVKSEYEIIAVNDGSTDSTKTILEKGDGIIIINNAYNLGYGASLKRGIKAAKYPWIFIVDADGTYPIKDTPLLLKDRDSYDMIVGARIGKNVNVPLIRRPAKFILTALARFLTRKKIPDLNSGMRIFKKEIAMEFFNLFPSGFSFTTSLTLACLTNNYLVKYVPIDYFRRKGESTIHPIKDFVNFIKIIFRIILYFEPFKFFIWPGSLLILAGLFSGTYKVLSGIETLGTTTVLLIVTGFQICLLGLLAEMIVKSRK